MKLYKEPTILISAVMIGLIIIVGMWLMPKDNSKATVDHHTPLPLQIGESTQSSSEDMPASTEDTSSTSESTSSSTTEKRQQQDLKRPIIPNLDENKKSAPSFDQSILNKGD